MAVYATRPSWCLEEGEGEVCGRLPDFNGCEVYKTAEDAVRALMVEKQHADLPSQEGNYITIPGEQYVVLEIDADWETDTWDPPRETVGSAVGARCLLWNSSFRVVSAP